MASRTDGAQTRPIRVFVMPKPITRTGIKTHNPQTVCIYGGKKGSEAAFEPHEPKLKGSALGTIFRKASDTSATPKRWMGKVGDPNGLLQNDPRSVRTVTRIEINISVTQEKIGADLYELLSGDRFGVAKTRLATLPVMDRFTRGHLLAQEWVRQQIIETLRVMSRFVDGYKDFTHARTREGGREYSFMEYIEEHRRPPDFLLTDEGILVPLEGFVELLAVGRMLADTDFIGGSGGNAGFKWDLGEDGMPIAKTYKIDPGFVLQCNSSANWAFNTYRNNDGRKLEDIRDIQIANNHDGVTIKWNSLTADQQSVFLSSLQHSTRYLSEEVLSFVFRREGHFKDMPADISQKMAIDFRDWGMLQLQIYQTDIIGFKRENPLHQLRIQYIDKWGELPLLLSEENVLISEFFTPLVIKEYREIEEEQPDQVGQNHMEGFGVALHSAKTIEPHQLFTEARHILLFGPPGAGKSTFCQEITHRWASGKLFNERFHGVYWISLRKLNKELDPGGFLHGVTDPDLFLARTIANILLEDQSLTDACLAEIKDNRERTLLVLDGYDEATAPLSETLIRILSDRELSILLTSRAGFTEHISTYIDQTIENTGFTDDGIGIYATRFFTRRQVSPLTQKCADNFLKAIKKTPDFFEISHNPLQLQILCSLWESGSEITGLYQSMEESLFSTLGPLRQRGLSNRRRPLPQLQALCSLWESGSEQGRFPNSVTGLYQRMVDQLFLWERHRGKEDPSEISETTKQSLFSTIGLIAQRGLAEGNLIISELDVTAWLEGGEWNKRDLLETGLLKPSGSGANTCYHFQHQIFQEYLAAYWISSRPQHEQEAFIQTYRDHPRYRVVIPFLAGITYQKDSTPSKEATKVFFQSLCQNVVLNDEGAKQELVQIIIKNINECPGYTESLPAVEALFQAHPSLLETEVQIQEIPEVPLHTAIRRGQVHFLKWLVGMQGKEVLNKTTARGLTPMHAAAMSGDLETIQWLDEQNPGLFCKLTIDDATSMHAAAMEGQLGVMQWLHEKDPELVRTPTNDGVTSMHLAALNGHLGAMQWLHGRDPQLIRKADKIGHTSMHYAARSGKLETMQWLHDKDPELFRTLGKGDVTLMHYAAVENQLTAMQWLYEKDPELVRIPENNGFTPMHIAIMKGKLEAMQWLHDKDPELFHTLANEGITSMHAATVEGHLGAMQWLHEKDPELFRRPANDGVTPMHLAAAKGRIEAMQWLHNKDPELAHKADSSGATPMHAAIMKGKLEAMLWLYDKDPEPFRVLKGVTPMHFAAAEGRIEAMQWLHDKDLQLIRKPNNDGITPMHVAALKGKQEVMQWLHEKDPELINSGKAAISPLKCAQEGGQEAAVNWLLAHGAQKKNSSGCLIS